MKQDHQANEVRQPVSCKAPLLPILQELHLPRLVILFAAHSLHVLHLVFHVVLMVLHPLPLLLLHVLKFFPALRRMAPSLLLSSGNCLHVFLLGLLVQPCARLWFRLLAFLHDGLLLLLVLGQPRVSHNGCIFPELLLPLLGPHSTLLVLVGSLRLLILVASLWRLGRWC